MNINYIEAAASIYIVLGIATYILMANYRNDMKIINTTEQMEQAASLSFTGYLGLILVGFILITAFWPLMAYNAFTTWKK